MREPVSIRVPGQPVGKARPRVTRNGAFTPKKTANFESLVKLSCQAQHHGPMLDGPLRMTVHAYFSIPRTWPKWLLREAFLENVWHTRKPDGSNVLKAVEDALNGVLYQDDSQIVHAVVLKRYSTEPRTVIEVQEMDGLHPDARKSDG